MKKIIIILLLLSGIQVRAESLSFEDFLSTTLNNSYKLKVAKLNTMIAKKGVNEARAGYLPTISAFATTQRYNDLTDGGGQITAVGSEIFLNRSYYQDMASVGLSYNLFDFGIRKRQLQISKAENEQKEILLQKDTKDLKLDTVELYAKTLALYKEAKIKEETLALQKELCEINKKLRQVGELSEIEVVDSAIKASEIKTDLDEIKNNLAKNLAEVSFYTNQSYDIKNVELQDFPANPQNTPEAADNIVKLSAELNTIIPEESFEVKAYNLEIYKKQKEYEIQKRANFPKIIFDTRYNLYGSDPSNFFSGLNDIGQRSLTFRLSTSFVLFDGFKNINTIAKSKMEVEKLKVQKEEQVAELKKKYEQIQLDSQNALIQNENNANTLALIDKNLKMLENLNTKGLVDKSSCINKRLNLLDKKLHLEISQIKIFTAQYKLYVLGKEGIEL